MKKGIILGLLIAFGLFLNIETISAAASYGKVFGGKITNSKAFEIQELESMGYECPMYGTSFSIIPIGSPTGTPINFFIPYYTVQKTGGPTSSGKLIMGKYSGITTISCILTTPEYTDVRPVTLYTVNVFGTSR